MTRLWLDSCRCNTARRQVLVEAGVPALSREWSSADYQQAATVLASGKAPLPLPAFPAEQDTANLKKTIAEIGR